MGEEWQVDVHRKNEICIFFIRAFSRKEAKSNLLEKFPWLENGAIKMTANTSRGYKLPFYVRIRR